MNEFPWEDNLLERKLESDLKDVLKTLVGFANSVKPGHKATLLIGEKDDGTIEGVANPDNIQKRIREECDKIYPPIIWRSQVYEKEGKHCVRVEVENSGDTPHFGGPAWIRKGSETIKASDDVFQRLINLRSSKVYELSKWINKDVTIYGDPGSVPLTREATYISSIQGFLHRWPSSELTAKVISINNFWISLLRSDTNVNHSEPLEKITLSFDDDNQRLRIIISY